MRISPFAARKGRSTRRSRHAHRQQQQSSGWLLAAVGSTFGMLVYWLTRRHTSLIGTQGSSSALEDSLQSFKESPRTSSLSKGQPNDHNIPELPPLKEIAMERSIINLGEDQPGSDNNIHVVPVPENLSCANRASLASHPSTTFLSQEKSKAILLEYVQQSNATNARPRFLPAATLLMKSAIAENQLLLTVQLGGMDGKTGDPMFKMAEITSSLKWWVPVVVEPVPTNFQKLMETYQEHQTKELPCAYLLHQMITYTPKNNDHACSFCHFDWEATDDYCKNKPQWFKTEAGSMECEVKMKDASFSRCFKQEAYHCTSIGESLNQYHAFDASSSTLLDHISILQMDVEGFEGQLLEGFFSELKPSQYPPIINFESRLLKARKQLQAVFDLLKSKGYGIHEKRADTLAILGAQGLELDPRRR